MRTRQEIKAIGKDRFKANYWPCVCVLLLVGLALSVITGVFYGPTYVTSVVSGDPEAVAESVGAGTYIGSVLLLLLEGPLTIGLNFFFVQNILGRGNELNVGTPFVEAFKNFGRKLGGFLWMALFVFLWSLLLWIPGIIKTFSYAMTPYILADCPNVRATDALKLSKRIMRGHKWQLFVFELSFIGWQLLSGLTFGILDIFYVGPYTNSASACWYLEVREEALRSGVITMGQLEGTEAVD